MEFGTNIFCAKFEKETKIKRKKDKIAKAAKFESKINYASHQDTLAQSNEEAEALEYGKALAQISKNLKNADFIA